MAYYHSAVLVSYLRGTGTKAAHAIIYTPHGIPSTSLSLATLQESNIAQVTALLHGLHEVWNPWWLGGKLNLGAHNGLAAVRNTGARYWIGTHDEVKRGGGFVAWVLNRKIWNLEDAIKREIGSVNDPGEGNQEDVRYVTLASGESLTLE